jgi:hypothetical protein
METILSPHVLFVVEKPPKDQEGNEAKSWNDFVYFASNEAVAGPHTRPQSPE